MASFGLEVLSILRYGEPTNPFCIKLLLGLQNNIPRLIGFME